MLNTGGVSWLYAEMQRKICFGMSVEIPAHLKVNQPAERGGGWSQKEVRGRPPYPRVKSRTDRDMSAHHPPHDPPPPPHTPDRYQLIFTYSPKPPPPPHPPHTRGEPPPPRITRGESTARGGGGRGGGRGAGPTLLQRHVADPRIWWGGGGAEGLYTPHC